MDAWVYDCAADLESSAAERMRRVPRDRDMIVCALRSTIQIALRTFLRTYNRFNVVGRENLPQRALPAFESSIAARAPRLSRCRGRLFLFQCSPHRPLRHRRQRAAVRS